MRRLMLLRHAKSSWDHMDLDDVDRPLAPRGRAAAPLLGRYISHENLQPDLVLCSSASRTRQTWELVSAEWDRSDKARLPRFEIRPSLYLAGYAEMLSMIQRIDGDIVNVMIIGHNPGMSQLAMHLVAQGDPRGLKEMSKKFPTAALAVIQFSAESWSSIKPGQGKLESFVRPKDLT
ncbi:MAG: SixA phosphatase family protein [Geminicoccaceae bacterium]